MKNLTGAPITMTSQETDNSSKKPLLYIMSRAYNIMSRAGVVHRLKQHDRNVIRGLSYQTAMVDTRCCGNDLQL